MNRIKQISQELDIPFYEKIPPLNLDQNFSISKIPFTFLKEHEVIPVEENDQQILIAVSSPEKIELLDHLTPLFDKQIRAVLASAKTIRTALHQFEQSQSQGSNKVMDEVKKEDFIKGRGATHSVQDLLDLATKGPVVKLVNHIIVEAMEKRATDIHVQPNEKSLDIRFRIDGILYNSSSPPKEAQEAIVSRIKVMSGLNIAEKRLPQDGRTTIKVGDKEIDIRVSVVPTIFGERVVLRLLDKSNLLLKCEELGFSDQLTQQFRSLISAPHGIVLVTGPTGGGKTTSLYAALSYLEAKSRNIMTVEDPIEYRLQGISQMQVKPEIGLTFASGLRSLLRQDPDVMMVGEIRDQETAQVAVQAALTGHLVLATLHTNDASSALVRLQDIGIEPYLISSTVRGILSQRLIRLQCSECHGKVKECEVCYSTGYSGRTGIYELLLMNEILKKRVNQKADETLLRKAALENGMIPLQEDGMSKVAQGLTTQEEVYRVIH